MHTRRLLHGLLIAALTLGTARIGAARAGSPPPPAAEVRLGVLWPDLGPPSTHLTGADINGELLLTTPLTGWTLNLPAWLRWAAAPRVNLGGTLNSTAATNQIYAGLTWTVPLATSLLHKTDGLSFGFSIGPDILGGNAVMHGLDQGAQLRLGAELGYQVTPRMGLFVLFNHVTGGPLTHEGDNSLNELGVRVGLHF